MARSRSSRAFRRILHPTDFSAASRPAFAAAVALSRASGAQLLVAHVLPVLTLIPDAYVASTMYEQLLEGQRAGAQKQLDRLVRRAKAAGIQASGILLDSGVPAEQITRLARSRRVDAIVMGTHGRTGLSRAVLGSVAARVIAAAPCPVVTVRA